MKRAFLLFALVLLIAEPTANAAPPARRRPASSSGAASARRAPAARATTAPPPAAKPAAPAAQSPMQGMMPTRPLGVGSDEESRFYRYKLVTALGLHLLRTSAVAVGGQFGFAPQAGTPWYVGPEVSFSLFSPGHALTVMVSTWYELRIFGTPRLSIGAGIAGGVSFTGALGGISSTTYATYLEAFLAQDIDDLSTVRVQFRPGLIGGYFSFITNFNVTFRFL